MRRFLLALIALSLCAGMVVYTLPVEAGKNYSESSVFGTWSFVSTEVRWNGEQCDHSGTIEFYEEDGDYLAVAEETYRCVMGGGVQDCDGGSSPPCSHTTNFTYEFDDGAVKLTNFNSSLDKTHCQIADHGRMLLCDGTLQPESNGTDKGAISFFAIAVKE